MDAVKIIQEIMKRENLKQRDMSKKTGLSPQMLSHALTKGMSIGTFSTIVDKLGYKISVRKKDAEID